MFQRNSNKMSRLSVIVRVNVVLSRAVIDSRFDVSSVLRFFLSLALVRSRRKVVIAFLCNAYGILYDCNTSAKASEVPLMYSIVTVVTGQELTLV